MNNQMAENFIAFVRTVYPDELIALHRPVFKGSEKKFLIDCIDSNFVSSVGPMVSEFEAKVSQFTGSAYAISTVNGTAGLHIALLLAGAEKNDEIITQALTFVATCNAISYVGASPVFVDVDLDTLGMSPRALENFLECNAELRDGSAWNKMTGKRISCCVPMHTFGLPCRIEEIATVCKKWGIALVEDAAESLGSFSSGIHTGLFGLLSVISFNGNKILTTGGGGMILTNDSSLFDKGKHLTTTAKKKHLYEFDHDEIAFNYRLPNINAALGCAQIEMLKQFLEFKRNLANKYSQFFDSQGVFFVKERKNTKSNYWLNAIVLDSIEERDHFLDFTNTNGVVTRPIWRLMSKLPMFRDCQNDGLKNSLWLEDRVVNIPSSVIL